MLTKLILKNISRVEEATVQLPQLLRIEGPNNSSKTSAVYRAIEVMMLGESFPESMVRRGQKSGYMALEFSDGRMIEYRRDGKKQQCILNYPDDTKRTFDTIKSSEEEIRKFTGGIVVKPDKKSDKETPQFVPISASQVYMIQGMSDETILKRLTNLAGGSGIAVAKQRIESSLREKKGEAKALEEIVCEARTAAETALTCLEPLDALNARHEASRGQESDVSEREQALAWLKEDFFAYSREKEGLGTLDWVTGFKYLAEEIARVENRDKEIKEREEELRAMQANNAELLNLESELDKMEVLMVELESQIAEEFERVPVCETCGREV